MFEQPKTDEVVTSARKGECSTCGAKGVLVSAPPMGRHIDSQACEQQRTLNRIAYAHGQVKIVARR